MGKAGVGNDRRSDSEVEERLKVVEEELAETGSDFEKAHALMQEQTALNEQLEQLIERWTYLAELAEGE